MLRCSSKSGLCRCHTVHQTDHWLTFHSLVAQLFEAFLWRRGMSIFNYSCVTRVRNTDSSSSHSNKSNESIFTGPGEVLIAPDVWGDIVPIVLDGSKTWYVGKQAFLAGSTGLVRGAKSQGLVKGICEYHTLLR